MNKKEDYAWNQYEQERHQQGLEPIPAPYKIKIKDDTSLRIQLEELLTQLPQAYLAEWALAIAQHFLPLMDPQLRNDPRIDRASEVFARRLSGWATAYEVRQAGFFGESISERIKDRSQPIRCAGICTKHRYRTYARACNSSERLWAKSRQSMLSKRKARSNQRASATDSPSAANFTSLSTGTNKIE